MNDEEKPAPSRPVSPPDARQQSEALKERVYVTFTALAVTVALERDAHSTLGGTALTLVLTVLGTLAAVFVADVVAHMVRESALPSKAELAHFVFVSFGSLGVLVGPMGILGLCALDVIDLVLALRVIALALIATLFVVTLLAVRRLQVGLGRKVLVLAIMTLLGLAVMAIELAVH